MRNTATESSEFQEILEQKRAELAYGLRNRAGMAIEKSADQMDEIQFASDRELEIQSVDRECAVLREVKAALQRMQTGSFGTCVDCGLEVGLKRLAAVPWASRCLLCQEADDRASQEYADVNESVLHAA